MTRIEAIKMLKNLIITGFKHKNHKKAIELRDFYLQVLTGENIDNLLPQFERRETPELWKQRKTLTIQNLVLASAPIVQKFFKTSRIPARKVLELKDELKKETIELSEASFYNNEDVENYLTEILDSYGMFDPNSFLVIDFMPFDVTETPDVYPTIFDCNEVFDYKYSRKGILEYLFVCLESTLYDGDKTAYKILDYYFYYKGGIIKASQIEPKARINPIGAIDELSNTNDVKFDIYAYETGSEKVTTQQVQARRIGYMKHPTIKSICVSPLHPAESTFKDLIRRKSELDVTLSLHVFPKLFQYGEECEGEVDVSPERVCQGGFIANTKTKCKKCGGSGFKPHRSAQDVILMKYPKEGREFVPLRDLAYYLSPDLNVIDKLDSVVQQKITEAYIACFSTDLLKKISGQLGETTATEVKLKKDDVNDTLGKWATNRSNIYKFIITQIGIFNDVTVDVTHEYPKTLESESLDELLAKYSMYVTNGVSPLIIDEIEMQIAKLQMDNDPTTFTRYKVQRMFLPFRGMIDAQKQLALSSTEVPRFTKVLFYNFQWIFTLVEDSDINFYDENKTFKDRFGALEKIVNDIVSKLEKEAPSVNLGLQRPPQQAVPPKQ